MIVQDSPEFYRIYRIVQDSQDCTDLGFCQDLEGGETLGVGCGELT
jgi:hypothetical protein